MAHSFQMLWFLLSRSCVARQLPAFNSWFAGFYFSPSLPAGQLQLMVDMSALNSPPPHQEQQQAGQQQPPAATQGISAGNHHPHHQELRAVRMPFGPPIKHLPPVRVQLQFPVNYPSAEDAAPSVTLHASWLGSSQQQQLQQQLQALWREQGPGPVCFSWLEHVKVSGLPALGVTEQLVLSAQQQQHGTCVDAAGGQAVAGGRSSSDSAGSGHLHKGHKQLSAQAPAFVPITAQPEAAAAAAGTCSNSGRGRGRSGSSRGGGRGRRRSRARSDHSKHDLHQHHQQQHDSKQDLQEGKEQQQQQQQLPLAAGGVSRSGGNAVVSVDKLAMQLLRYDAARELDDFNNSSWTCNICFTQVCRVEKATVGRVFDRCLTDV